MMQRGVILLLAFAGALKAAEVPPAALKATDFAHDIEPIFREHCLDCHGPKKQKSDYRLDVREAAMRGGESGEAAIVAGQGAESRLVQFVTGLDADLLMPPRKSDKARLTPAQIGLLRRWIDDGAVWPEAAGANVVNKKDWWSLKPVVKPAVPAAAGNPIDAFITAKLTDKGLAMSPEADAHTLCRRLYFDLTGLPPTPEEMDTFVADQSPDAYERLVDALLGSPRYGERWARHWLDVVHFGETHGYDKDQPRPNAWPYRDYVIRALNEDKPYARFVQEQVAGDVLFPGTRDGLEALGFIAAGPWDLIGHAEVAEEKTDGKIARHLDRDDMVANTINTFCSLTVHCAQCHDHKFDPISAEDYYSLQSVFAALDRAERKYYRDDALNGRFQTLQREQRTTDAALAVIEGPLRQRAGEAFIALTRRIEGASAAKQGNASPDFGYHSAISPTADATKWVQVDLGQRMNLERVTLRPCYDDFNAIGAGFGFPVRFKVEASDDPEFKTGVTLFWQKHDQTFMADFANPALASFTTNGAKDDGIAGRYVRVTATKLAPRKDDFIFALAEMQVFDTAGTNVAQGRPVTAFDSIEAPPRWRKTNLTDGVAPVAPSVDEKDKLLKEREALLISFANEAAKTQRAALLSEQMRVAAELKALPTPSAVYAGTVHSGSGTFIGTGAKGGKPRAIFLLARGDVKRPGREMSPGAISGIEALPARFDLPPDAPEGERRAALARWLTDAKHPLTWRSIVNRVWQYHFGRGLVETPNDFGHMGALPSHPELLDWLAVTFRDEMNGSFKQLHRRIVTSAAYRQSSATINEKTAQFDSGNTLLWRQNRRKLEAEAVRDSVLAVAGKLDLTMGGPSFQDFVITHPEHSPHYEYQLADPENPAIHRRSIYRFLARSQQQPWMAALDCADPSMLVDKRNQTITPLQALAQLNNQLMVVMAKHFAARVEKAGADLPAKISAAFRLALQRPPTADELTTVTAYATQHGLANACRLIVNLNEFAFAD